MELYEYARPGLMAGKKVLYVHGFASSGQTGSVHTLRLLLPDAAVVAPDLPVDPNEAMNLLRDIVSKENPDLVIGTSMGGMYTEMLYGVDRILVNPAFQLADTILKNNGLGRREFHNKRADGETSFLVTKSLLERFREVSSHCFERASDDKDRVFGLFGIRDTLVDTLGLFHSHYPQAIRFDGEHHLNDSVIVHSLLPIIQRIDDRQNGVSRPVVFISLSDTLVNHSSGMPKAVETLATSYDVHIVSGFDYNTPGTTPDVVKWCEANLGVPVWNRVSITNHKNLLLADYLIDAEPELNGGQEFMGTLIHFGSDTFKTWEDILTYFSRLGGQ
ncbi:MAG: esterase [Bacteroidales bacterium]|nr:esterase [Bacteroidales bacterium]